MTRILFPLAAMAASLAVVTPAAAQDGSRMLEQMEQADRNGDGAVSPAELLAYRASQFDRLDRNDDGVLDNSDMPRMARIREHLEARVAAFDQNGDGRITRSEFANGPTTLFDRADTNGDNVVTKAELTAARAALASEMGR